MCNFFGIILPGIVSYIVWTLHFNATRKKNILKSILVLAFSICPVLNWISFGVFLSLRLVSICDENFNPLKEKQDDDYFGYRYENKPTPFAMFVPYDKTTKSGKIIMWFVKDR